MPGGPARTVHFHLPTDILVYIFELIVDHFSIAASGFTAIYDLYFPIQPHPFNIEYPFNVYGLPVPAVVNLESDGLRLSYHFVEDRDHVYSLYHDHPPP